MAAVPSPWAYVTHRDCLRAPLPARGETDPFSAPCLPALAPEPSGLYIHFAPPPSVHVLFYAKVQPFLLSPPCFPAGEPGVTQPGLLNC